jgi:hypothetical protein
MLNVCFGIAFRAVDIILETAFGLSRAAIATIAGAFLGSLRKLIARDCALNSAAFRAEIPERRAAPSRIFVFMAMAEVLAR